MTAVEKNQTAPSDRNRRPKKTSKANKEKQLRLKANKEKRWNQYGRKQVDAKPSPSKRMANKVKKKYAHLKSRLFQPTKAMELRMAENKKNLRANLNKDGAPKKRGAGSASRCVDKKSSASASKSNSKSANDALKKRPSEKKKASPGKSKAVPVPDPAPKSKVVAPKPRSASAKRNSSVKSRILDKPTGMVRPPARKFMRRGAGQKGTKSPSEPKGSTTTRIKPTKKDPVPKFTFLKKRTGKNASNTPTKPLPKKKRKRSDESNGNPEANKKKVAKRPRAPKADQASNEGGEVKVVSMSEDNAKTAATEATV